MTKTNKKVINATVEVVKTSKVETKQLAVPNNMPTYDFTQDVVNYKTLLTKKSDIRKELREKRNEFKEIADEYGIKVDNSVEYIKSNINIYKEIVITDKQKSDKEKAESIFSNFTSGLTYANGLSDSEIKAFTEVFGKDFLKIVAKLRVDYSAHNTRELNEKETKIAQDKAIALATRIKALEIELEDTTVATQDVNAFVGLCSDIAKIK